MRTFILVLVAAAMIFTLMGCGIFKTDKCSCPCMAMGDCEQECGLCKTKKPCKPEYLKPDLCNPCSHDVCEWFCR